MNMASIKIFVSYKDKHKIFQSDIITPIQTGRAIADEIYDKMIGDDTGDNISAQNPKYNELSAQYWVWKHYKEIGTPDFVGFMHYRRHFLFNSNLPTPEYTWLNNSSVYLFSNINNNYLEYLKDSDIQQYFPKYDCMVIKPYNIKNIKKRYRTIRDNYVTLKEQEGYFYDIFIDVIKSLHPDYIEEIEEFKNGLEMYLCNMFVMRKDLFEDYSKFLFSTLAKIDEKINSTGFSENKLRFLGFIGEFILSIYMFKLRKNSEINIIEMNASFIYEPEEKDFKKYNKYKLLRHFTLGTLHKKYNYKFEKLNYILNNDFLNQTAGRVLN